MEEASPNEANGGRKTSRSRLTVPFTVIGLFGIGSFVAVLLWHGRSDIGTPVEESPNSVPTETDPERSPAAEVEKTAPDHKIVAAWMTEPSAISKNEIAGLLSTLSSSKIFERWLSAGDWVRRITAAANRVAEGESPEIRTQSTQFMTQTSRIHMQQHRVSTLQARDCADRYAP